MVDVVGIHGIAQQQRGRNQLLADWQLPLYDGIEQARQALRPSLDIVFYGDLFLRDTGWKGAPAELATMDQDTLDFLVEVQDEVAQDVPADKGPPELPAPLAKLATWLDRRFGVAGRMLFFGDLIQVRKFQRDDELADAVLRKAEKVLASEPRVLIGHSLGSIVAYEALHTFSGVATLVTLGSPLALTSVRRGLRHGERVPPGVRNWVNVYDPSDPVSCAGGLAPFWPAVDDRTVDNEGDPHSVLRYLGKAATGDAVFRGLS